MKAPRLRSRSRRETFGFSFWSDIAFPHFLGQIFGRAPGERHDRERDVLVGIAAERRGVGHEQVLHFVRLAELVQHAVFGSSPIRTVPASWMMVPPIEIPPVSRSGFFRPVTLAAHGFDDVR